LTSHPQVTLESAPHLPLWDQKLEAGKQENPQNRWPDNWIRRPILGEHHLLDLHLFQQPVPFKQANDVLFTGISWGIFVCHGFMRVTLDCSFTFIFGLVEM